MNVLLFISLPYISHYNSMFDLARHKRNFNNQVYFAGYEKHRQLCENEGFEFINFSYIIEIEIRNFKTFCQVFFLSITSDKFQKDRYREYFKAKSDLEKIVLSIKPNIIFLDEYIFDYFFLIPRKQKIVLINTRPSTKKVSSSPPLNSSFIPKNNLTSVLYIEWLWLMHLALRKFKKIIYQVALLGKSDAYFLNRIGEKNDKIYNQVIDERNCLNATIKNLETINLSPFFFEFNQKERDKNESFFFERISRLENFDERYIDFIGLLKEKKQKKIIIYFSVGTLSEKNIRDANSLLTKVCNSLANNSKYELIISSKFFKRKKFSSNIHHFEYLPQLDFLTYCDIMINHGGIGSIKECIQKKVKILSYPLNLNTDQPGCAARVQELGFGLMGNIKTETEEGILKKIEKLSQMNIYN